MSRISQRPVEFVHGILGSRLGEVFVEIGLALEISGVQLGGGIGVPPIFTCDVFEDVENLLWISLIPEQYVKRPRSEEGWSKELDVPGVINDVLPEEGVL